MIRKNIRRKHYLLEEANIMIKKHFFQGYIFKEFQDYHHFFIP